MNLDGKRVILTGAASGIGKALLERLAQYQVQIVAADLNSFDTNPSASKASIYSFTGDLGQQSEIDRLFDYAVQTMDGVDLFIANAGFAYYEKIGAANWQHMEKIFRVNIFSPLYAVAKMRDLNPSEAYTVVITASAMSFLAIPGYAYYSATKAALDRFAEAYRYELPANGRLTLVYPIATRTNFFNRANKAAPVPFPAQTADYVAGRIIAGIQRDKNAIYPSLLFRGFWPLGRALPFFGKLYQAFYARYLP